MFDVQRMGLIVSLAALSGCVHDAQESAEGQLEATAKARDEIVQGVVVEGCGWAVTASLGGCTASLVHPRAIATAQHCGTPTSVAFGNDAQAPEFTATVAGCVGTGSEDAMICELTQPVPIPYAPILFGCEVAQYLTVGQPVVISGFGQTSFGMGGGSKRWGAQTIEAVEAQRVIVGEAGVLPSPCPGDSGGPAHVQVADGSWRTIGTVFRGTTGIPCNSAADFQRLDVVVAAFEQQRGLDITPCFDAMTGAWDPSEDCGDFYAGSEVGTDTWANQCVGEPTSGFSDTCGPPFGGGQGGSGGMGDGGMSGVGGAGGVMTGTGGSDTGGAAGEGGDVDGSGGQNDFAVSDDSGCGCAVPGTPAPANPLALLGLMLLGRTLRRRKARHGEEV